MQIFVVKIFYSQFSTLKFVFFISMIFCTPHNIYIRDILSQAQYWSQEFLVAAFACVCKFLTIKWGWLLVYHAKVVLHYILIELLIHNVPNFTFINNYLSKTATHTYSIQVSYVWITVASPFFCRPHPF